MSRKRGASCLPCRLRKKKCDHQTPCSSCIKSDLVDDCLKNPPAAGIFSSNNPPTIPKTLFPIKSAPSKIVKAPTTKKKSPSIKNEKEITPTKSSTLTTPMSSTNHSSKHNYRAKIDMKFVTQLDQEIITNLMSQKMENLLSVSSNIATNTYSLELLSILRLLPNKTQCDGLVNNFFALFCHMYCTVHPQWFQQQYLNFWNSQAINIDPLFLSMLFAVLSVSTLETSHRCCVSIEISPETLKELPHKCYNGAMACLRLMDFEKKPNVLSLVTLSILQSYFFSTKKFNIAHDNFKKRVSIALALNLNHVSDAETFEDEQKRRLWWDIVSSDLYSLQAQGKQRILKGIDHTTPLPTHCNDEDIHKSYIIKRPSTEITHISHNLISIKLQIIYLEHLDEHDSFDSVSAIAMDQAIEQFLANEPYFTSIINTIKEAPAKSKPELYSLYHITWSSIQTQRFRTQRNFLNPRVDYSFNACINASTSILAVYKQLRQLNWDDYYVQETMLVQGHVAVGAAVAEVIFMLVERPPNLKQIWSDVEMVVNDLKKFQSLMIHTKVIDEGVTILEKFLELQTLSLSPLPPDSKFHDNINFLTKKIGDTFGGTVKPDKYLNRLSIGFLVHSNESTPTSTNETHINTNGVITNKGQKVLAPAPQQQQLQEQHNDLITGGNFNDVFQASEWFLQQPWETWSLDDWINIS